jgi:hypothetical protein
MTASDTVAKTTTLAMYAVAQHMLDRRLPAPFSIAMPVRCARHGHPQRIKIGIPSADITEWLDSVLVVTERTEPALIDGIRWIREEYDVLVPSPVGDVAATIALVRQADLELLPGGAA